MKVLEQASCCKAIMIDFKKYPRRIYKHFSKNYLNKSYNIIFYFEIENLILTCFQRTPK